MALSCDFKIGYQQYGLIVKGKSILYPWNGQLSFRFGFKGFQTILVHILRYMGIIFNEKWFCHISRAYANEVCRLYLPRVK